LITRSDEHREMDDEWSGSVVLDTAKGGLSVG